MKRLFSIIISSLFFATSAWAISVKNINSYAANLSLPNGGNVNANRQVTISFYTMAKTSKWWVYMDINKNGLFEDDGEIIAQNENAQITTNNVTTTVVCTIPDTVPVGEYNWAVKVQGTEDHSWEAPHVARNYENDDNRYLFVKALGVAVDCNYNSPFFGYSYVTESYTTNLTGYKTPSDKTYRQASTEGVYMFTYNMGTVWNKDASGKLVNNGAYIGDLQSSIANNTTALSGTTSKWGRDDEINYYKEHSPFRICTGVDDEGYVYVSENVPSADRAQKVFRMDPNNPKASFKVVLTNDDLEGLNIVKRVQSMTVTRTSDGKKVLYAIFSGVDDGKGDGDMGNGVLTYPKLCAFDITDLGDVKCIKGPINLYDFKATNRPDDTQKVLNTFNSIVAGKNDDFWIFQHRAPNANDATAGTLHFNKNWQCDFVLYTTSTRGNTRGVGALSHDGTILAVPTNASSGSENIRFYKITYDENDKSTVKSLKKLYDLPAYQTDADGKHILSTLPKKLVDKVDGTTQQHFIDGMAFDVANNLYFISGGGLGPTSARSRLYVYALPKADNSHLTPARSSLKIRVSEGLTWHPYPDGYNVTNADLQAMFNTDRANWSGSLTDFMTNNSSPWKWLGDYIAAVTNANAKLPANMDTNEELWGTDPAKDGEGYPSDGFKAYYNTYYNLKRANRVISMVSTFASEKMKDIMTNDKSDYKWLGDYIKTVVTEQGDTLESENDWRWQVHAFFNKSKKDVHTWYNDQTKRQNANFSEAGKSTAWGPAYLAAHGGYVALETDADWQTQLDAFFNATGDFTTAGLSDQVNEGANGWFNEWWNANFPSAMIGSVPFPTVKRIGYVQNGWYYGGSEGYEEADRETSNAVTKSGHIWARWLQNRLYDGYITINTSNQTEFSDGERDIKQVNRNIELIGLVVGQDDYSITVDRKLVGGMYNTMCLPFDIHGKSSLNNIKNQDGSKTLLPSNTTSILRFKGSQTVTTSSGEDVLELLFVELGTSETLPANEPFLIKPANDMTEIMYFTNVTISNTNNQEPTDGVTFIPVIAPTTIAGGEEANNLILVADNRLALNSGGEMLGLRGYFHATDLPAGVRARMRIGNTTTEIENIAPDQPTTIKILKDGQIYILRGNEVYTITGAKVR